MLNGELRLLKYLFSNILSNYVSVNSFFTFISTKKWGTNVLLDYLFQRE